jgi:hypothetical protein
MMKYFILIQFMRTDECLGKLSLLLYNFVACETCGFMNSFFGNKLKEMLENLTISVITMITNDDLAHFHKVFYEA